MDEQVDKVQIQLQGSHNCQTGNGNLILVVKVDVFHLLRIVSRQNYEDDYGNVGKDVGNGWTV